MRKRNAAQCRRLRHRRHSLSSSPMFTIEHDFDATTVTLVDEGPAPLRGDIIVNIFDDQVTVEQLHPETGEAVLITLSVAQVEDLRAALDLPEGIYRRTPP